MRFLSNAMLKLTYIWVISEGIGDGLVVIKIAGVKEADIEYSFLAGWGMEIGREDIYNGPRKKKTAFRMRVSL
jgi:hypothetical protein